MKQLFPILAAGAIAAACSGGTATTPPRPADGITQASAISVGSNKARPAAIVYRTTRDYSNNVPVTLDKTRTSITSYPDPADLRNAEAKPLPLADGYLLDRRGITTTTAFLDYTYEQYAALPEAPDRATLTAHIIDRNPFTEMYSLPITAAEARTDTTRCRTFITSGFKGCTPLLTAPKPIKIKNLGR